MYGTVGNAQMYGMVEAMYGIVGNVFYSRGNVPVWYSWQCVE